MKNTEGSGTAKGARSPRRGNIVSGTKTAIPNHRYCQVVAGMPVKPIRKRFPKDVIAKLEELKWGDMPEDELKEHITLFQQENVTVEELENLQ